MSKKIGKLAKRYAKALLIAAQSELGTEGTPTPAQQLSEQLNQLAQVWAADQQLTLYILSPKFPLNQRVSALIEVAKAAGLPVVVQNFLRVLVERDRIHALTEIIEAYGVIANEAAGQVIVSITTAKAIGNDEAADVEQRLLAKVEGKPIFEWNLDPELLGGMVVEYGGKVLDGSLKGRLARLERNLLN